MHFGEKIKELRKENNWTQEELSDKIGTDKRQVSFYENDKYIPSSETLINIARTFNVSVDYLLFEDIPKHKLYSDNEFFQKLDDLDKISENDRKIVIGLINSLIEKNKVKELVLNMS